MIENVTTGLHSEEIDEVPEFRSISGTAVLGFLLALFSPVVLVRDLLVVVPVVAAGVCGVALYRIARSEGRLLGRTVALIGLGIACFFAASAPARQIAWRRALHARATPIAEAWLEALQRRAPHIAHQLTKPDATRRTLSDAVWKFYRSDRDASQELRAFVEQPGVRFLLTLGEDARIRLYELSAMERASSASLLVTQHYAVTYDDPDTGRTTFFVSVTLERREGTGGAGEQWRVADFTPGIRPSDYAF